MAVITDIIRQKSNAGRVSIFIDGEFFCGLDVFTQKKHRLNINDEIDTETLARVVFDGECESAFEKAMRLIAVRPRSEAEIIKALNEKRYRPEVIEAAAEKLKRYNYIDDREFIRLYAASHSGRWGKKKIEYCLKRIGVDPSVLEEELSSLPPQTVEAKRLLVKFIGSKPLDAGLKQKAVSHLMNKGFDIDTVKEAFSELRENSEEYI
jgi:regulatory protein